MNGDDVVRTSKASAAADGEAAFEAWAYRQAPTLPPWWPDGQRGEQAAAFLAAALKAAWVEGFTDEHVRYEESAWRHSCTRHWVDQCQLESPPAADASDPHVTDTGKLTTRA